MKTISIKLAEALDERIAAEVARRATTKSELIREAIEAYLNPPRVAGLPSFTQLARDLAGCVEGPEDLSVSGDHLADYGA